MRALPVNGRSLRPCRPAKLRNLPRTAVAEREVASSSAQECPMMGLKPLPKSDSMTNLKRWTLFSDPPAMMELALGKKKFVEDKFLVFIPALFVGNTAIGKEIAMSEGDKVTSSWPPSTTALIGQDSLLNMQGARHRQVRTVLNTALGPDAVSMYLPQIQELAVNILDRAVDTSSAVCQTISGKTLLRSYTFQVVLSLTLGKGAATDAEVAEMESLFNLWQKSLFTPFTFDVPPFPFHYAMNARKKLLAFLQRRIDVLRKDPAAQGGGEGAETSSTLLQSLMLLNTGNGGENIVLTDSELRDNVLNILFAGFDTTASALASCLYYLQKHPKVLRSIREEQDKLVVQFGPEITPDVLQKMRYLDAVVKETMRSQPPVAGAFRKAAMDFELEGHLVPKDLFLTVNYGFMAAHDERWQHLEGDLSPGAFNPARHLTEEGQKQGSQVLFGMGPRTCPGNVLSLAEQKVLLAVLSRGYDFLADLDTTWDKTTVPNPANGLPIYVRKRPATA